MNKRKYIKLQYTDYGYEIYAITGNKKIRLNSKDKIIMSKILRGFQNIPVSNDVYIYPNYQLITLYFRKEKIKSTPKKVNRNKSKQIISGILVLTTLIVGSKMHSKKSLPEPIKPEITTTYNADKLLELQEETDMNLVEMYEYAELYNELEEQGLEEDYLQFCYEYDTPNDKEALMNAEQYMDTFKKYEKIYGVDANLLCAIGAQESSGIHHQNSINGGYATGLMGIEYIWDGGEIYVFNFETNCYEKIIVDYSKIGELDYNIKIGAAIFQNYFYNTLRYHSDIEDGNYFAFALQQYNMGPGNMNNILSMGSNWLDNRDMINAGDPLYIEHVLSRLDNDTIIRLRLEDGSYYETQIVNTALTHQYHK